MIGRSALEALPRLHEVEESSCVSLEDDAYDTQDIMSHRGVTGSPAASLSNVLSSLPDFGTGFDPTCDADPDASFACSIIRSVDERNMHWYERTNKALR